MAQIFCLTDSEGRLLPPAVQATILAKYSRSPESAKELVAKLSAEEADKFQEKWVGQYGHNSVAEMATVPICFEGVSIIASKVIESWQRPGYSEKSTRYQVFSGESFVTPPGGPPTMKEFAQRFYSAYDKLRGPVTRRCAELMGEDPDDPNPKKTVAARAFDNIRYLLPAGTGTNLAAAMNMRDLRDMVTKLRGHPSPEFREIGDGVLAAGTEICPALMKYTDPDHWQLIPTSVGSPAKSFDPSNPKPYVEIHRAHLMPQPKLEQAAFESLVVDMHGMGWAAFSKFMEGRPAFAEVPDVFKTVKISFEVMMDYGAFRDLQRHRRCEQFVEPLRPDYGYVVPDDIAGTELEGEYRAAMESINAYGDESVVHDPYLMQYLVPLGFLHRSVFQMDLKELYYVAELRTKPQGHISYRRIAHRMYELANYRLPELMQWCRVTPVTGIGVHN